MKELLEKIELQKNNIGVNPIIISLCDIPKFPFAKRAVWKTLKREELKDNYKNIIIDLYSKIKKNVLIYEFIIDEMTEDFKNDNWTVVFYYKD